jgi:hypothetical protein
MTRRLSRARAEGALAALVLSTVLSSMFALGSGCSLVLDHADPGPLNRCAADGDCRGARCDTSLGMCVADPETSYVYALQLVIPADESAARPALAANAGPFIASGGESSSGVVIGRPVPVVGRIRVDRDPGTAVDLVPLDAEIELTPRVIDGSSEGGPRLPSIIVGTLEATPGSLSRENDYLTQLIPGLAYQVEIRPRGQDARRYAPLRTELVLEGPQRFDIAEYPSELDRYVGVVVDPANYAQSGLEVRAIEVATGRLVSTVATSGRCELEGCSSEPGRFDIAVDPGAGPWVFRISAPPAYQDERAFPTITIDPSVLAPDASGYLRMLVPSPTDGRCFAGTIEFPGGAPAHGATITLRSRTIEHGGTGLLGSFTVQMTSSGRASPSGVPSSVGCSGSALPEGGFEGRVLPGTYDIEIHPVEPGLGVYVGEVIIRADADTLGHVFAMPRRTIVAGQVQRSGSEPVADAQVRALALHLPLADSPSEGLDAALLNRTSETTTGESGLFELPLDVGLYDLIIEPPGGSGFPWMVQPDVEIRRAIVEPTTEVFEVGAPLAIRGEAFFDDGSPVRHAEISAFAIVGRAGSERSVPIGRAVTEDDGTFLLLLPAALR